jgi:hypothetical protein
MMAPSKHSELTIVVTLPGQDQRTITGRVARMIAWLCDNQRQVERIKRGRLDVGFSGDYQEWHITETKPGF